MDFLSPFRSITRRIVATTSKYTMPSPPIFLGPPEIYPLPSPAPSRKPPSLLSPFIDAMTQPSPRGRGGGGGSKTKTTDVAHGKRLSVLPIFGKPLSGFLQHAAIHPPETVRELLRRAWAHNPLTTLKLILHRKWAVLSFDEEVFYPVVFWLHQNHPKTLALNVRWFAQVDVDYMNNLLDILFREVAPPDVLEIEKEENELLGKDYSYLRQRALERIMAEKERLRPELARRFVERYNSDSNYRILYDSISDFLVESLKTDIGFLDLCEFRNIGYAAFWIPSLDSLSEYSTLLCESIAKRVFPRESDPSYAQMDEAHYSYIVRERLTNLLPLLQQRGFSHAVKVPERVLPQNILSFLQCNYTDEIREWKWKGMVEHLSKTGKLTSCLSVCDVSGSMDGTPMEVCVALGLLASELSEEPWRGNVINFSENPQLYRIQGKTLQEKVEFIKRMEWGMNIDFQKVFDRILDVAVASKLEEKKMVKRVFVFTDNPFGEASKNSWETDYHAIQRKYEEKGYGSSVPEIVFWNFKFFFKMPPVAGREKGVLLVSGFSKNLLNIFLDNGGVVNPEEVMEEAIAREVYEKVSVLD